MNSGSYGLCFAHDYLKRVGLILCVFATLVGCSKSDPGTEMLEDYLYRLSNTLDTDIDQTIKLEPLPLYPSAKVSRFELEPLKQGVIEVFDLSYCDGILDLVAERNSSLGKVMKVSTHYRYELNFYDKISACRTKAQNDPDVDKELLATINSIYQQKTAQLPQVAWNGLFASDEIDQQFSRTEALISPSKHLAEGSNIPELKQAVERLSHIAMASKRQGFQLPADRANTEIYYEALYRQPLVGQLHNSLAALTMTMERATLALNERTEVKPLCVDGRHSKQKPILANVFERYYLGEFQPYLAKVHRLSQAVLMPLDEAYATLPKPEGFSTFGDFRISMEYSDGLWQRYIRARDGHTKAWQAILRLCRIRDV